MLQTITKELIEEMAEKARTSPRKRALKCLHTPPKGPEDNSYEPQRLVNAFQRDTYAQPHKHGNRDANGNEDPNNPSKLETFTVLKGKLYVVFFDDQGHLREEILLSNDLIPYVEVPPGTWHTVVGESEVSVGLEVKVLDPSNQQSPTYNMRTDKFFAPWAPKEGTPEAVQYLEGLRKRLAIFRA
ncbi:MAG: WbuC family cupin fold metalloprotein [Nanoarchaeota archaeon]